MGPGDADVRTGVPPSKRNVAPLLVALSGTFETFPLMELTRKEMTVAFAADAAGM